MGRTHASETLVRIRLLPNRRSAVRLGGKHCLLLANYSLE